ARRQGKRAAEGLSLLRRCTVCAVFGQDHARDQESKSTMRFNPIASCVRRLFMRGSSYGQPRLLWQPVSSAPLDRDLEVQVADGFGTYRLKFLCRLTGAGWVNAQTNTALAVQPVNWRMPNR